MYYKIILTGILPKRRLSVLGGIRTMFCMRLIEAKQATEAPPTMLDSGFTREEAQKLKEQIELRGGIAEIAEDYDSDVPAVGLVTVRCPECGYDCLKRAHYPDWGNTPPFGFTNETTHICYACNAVFQKAYPQR